MGGVGGYLSASGTQSAQNQQNAAAAQQAAMQSAQSFNNYLSSRGISIQQIAAANPRFETEYARVKAAGDKRPFDVWLYDHLKANPSDSAWQQINTGSVGAQNTTLPNWAVDASGNPLQPSLLNQLVGIQSGANNPATAPIGSLATLANARALLQARPDLAAELAAAGVGNDGRTPEQWLIDHITQTESQSGGGTFTDALRQFAVQQAAAGAPGAPAAGPAGTGNNTTLDPAIAALIPGATKTVGNIFDGTFFNQVTGALQPVADARNANAAAQLARINELRGLSGNVLDTELGGIKSVLDARTAGAGGIFDASIASATGVRDAATQGAQKVYDTNVAKLADLLGVRREAAAQIYDASIGAAGGVRDASLGAAGSLRDARTTGAKDIYGAESLRADTYAQSAQDALGRILAEQTAERARRGFTGGSSGSDIVRARLMADYTQRGAGDRAQAGVNYQGRLSDAGIGYATDTGRAQVGYATDAGRAGIGRATTLGQANEQDSMAKLNAAVDLARQLGLVGTNFATATGTAGVTKATSLAGAGEQNAIAQLQAKVADATRRLGYLTSDADIAKANADLANAQDALKALMDNQNRMVGATSAPFQLAGADLSLKDALTSQQYGGIDALLKRLSSFSTTPANGPALTTTTPGAVLNNTQIAGGVLSGLGSVIGNTSNNASLADLIKLLGGGGAASTTPAAAPAAANGYNLGGSPGFLAGASVFGGPG